MSEQFFEMYLEEMGAIEPLAEAEKAVLLGRAAAGDGAARKRLVEGSLKAVLELAREFEGRELPLSDVVQEANAALMLAAVEYDGSELWDELWKRRAKEAVELALKEQRTEDDIKENVAARVNVLQTVSQMMAKELGREATVAELAEKMKMTEDEIRDIMKQALDALTVSGEGAVAADGGMEEDTASDPIRNGWDLNDF